MKFKKLLYPNVPRCSTKKCRAMLLAMYSSWLYRCRYMFNALRCFVLCILINGVYVRKIRDNSPRSVAPINRLLPVYWHNRYVCVRVCVFVVCVCAFLCKCEYVSHSFGLSLHYSSITTITKSKQKGRKKRYTN